MYQKKIAKYLVVLMFGVITFNLTAAQPFSVDVARYLLANQDKISRTIDLQVAVISHDEYGADIKDAWDGDSQRGSRGGSQTELDDFILYRIAKSQDVDFLGLVKSASDIKSSRETPIYDTWGNDINPDGICLLPYAPFTILALSIDIEPLSDEDVLILERAFDEFAPRYGALLDAMQRNNINPDRSSRPVLDPGLSLGFAAKRSGYDQCGPRVMRERTKGVDQLFPHLANRFDARAGQVADRPIARFRDLSRISLEGLSLAQLSFLKKVFSFTEDYPLFFTAVERDHHGGDLVGLLETEITKKAEDFSEFGLDGEEDSEEFDFDF